MRGRETGLMKSSTRPRFAHGYQPGEHCQGGGYAIAGQALSALRSAGSLHDPFLWAHDPLTEDVALALCVKSLGLDLASANGPGQPFGVQYSGLAFPPDELLARGHAVIHSVKNAPAHPEADLRAFFRSQRPA